MSGIPPRDAFAAAARRAIEEHDEWDSPHCFETLHWDGERLSCRTYACIMPDINAPDYPALMAKLAREELEKHPAEPAYAYLLQIESFGVAVPGKDASEEERRQYDADRAARTFHKRPDAMETAIAWCADVHGRLWVAVKVRGKDGIRESFYPPGKAPGGRMAGGQLACAHATGMTAYGLPAPGGLLN